MKIWRRLIYYFWYLRKPPWDTGISPPELMEFLSRKPAGRAIDLGCGTGTNVVTMAKAGWEVCGVDFVPRAIRTARNKAQKAGLKVDLRVGDVTRLEGIEGPFDLALDMGCFHSLDREGQQKYLANLERILGLHGSFLLYVFFREEGKPGPGVIEADLDCIASRLQLVWREDGSERGWRPAAWLEFRRR